MATLGTVSINEGKVLRLWFEVDQFREPTQSLQTPTPHTLRTTSLELGTLRLPLASN
jgi:hypothetical protein